jgi:hypothetical protein
MATLTGGSDRASGDQMDGDFPEDSGDVVSVDMSAMMRETDGG